MTEGSPGVRGFTGTVIIVISTIVRAPIFIYAEIRESKDEYCDGKQRLATTVVQWQKANVLEKR
jgi:hypothetical protein